MVAAASLGLLLLVYHESVVSLVATWYRSETYAHGFLVLPASAWLLWRMRGELSTVPLRPFLPGILLLGGLSVAWLFGHAASIQTIQEFALVASVPTMLMTVLGKSFARHAMFPLLFILFAWPFGEFLIPPLIDHTADVTVAALRLSGIPVFRQGSNFTIPSGDWSVVDACSGIRYLIAALFAGSLFAYVSFRSWKRSLLFLGLAVIVSVVANWLRAYIIVLVAHLTDNKLGVGTDHVVLGWVFYGLVMGCLFYLGVRWSDLPQGPATAAPSPPATARDVSHSSPLRAGIAGILAVGVALLGPVWGEFGDRARSASIDVIPLALSPAHSPWMQSDQVVTRWDPAFVNPTAMLHQSYAEPDGKVDLIIAFFRNQRPGSKLLTFNSTVLSDYDTHWQTQKRSKFATIVNGTKLPFEERQISSSSQNLLVWQWYWVDGVQTTDVMRAKTSLAKARLLGDVDHAAGIVLVAEYTDDPQRARRTLTKFLETMHQSIVAALERSAMEPARD